MGLVEIRPNNLYFNIAQKAAKYITPVNNKNKINTSWTILGNPISFYYGGDQVNLVVGNKRYVGHGSNLKALEEALYNLFQGELKGEVSLSRPDNRSMLSDRNDFNKASGTCFSSLYKSVACDKEGKKNAEVKGSRSNAYALTEKQFENASTVKSFKQSNFTKINREGTQFYINKGVEFLDFNATKFIEGLEQKPVELSKDEFYKVLVNQENNLGMWARTDELYKLYENIELYKVTAVLYKGGVWIVIPKQGEYQVQPLI